MSRTYISETLRRLVEDRANHCCEYCRLHQEDGLLPHEVDHIIAEKHRGQTSSENLCLSCFDCNRYKGSDISSIDLETFELTALFNPRQQRWSDHFMLNANRIEPLTPQGRVTEFLLQMNTEERLQQRAELILLQRYPCSS